MSSTHKNISTPDPRFTALAVSVNEASVASIGGKFPAVGTLYKDFPTSIVSKDYLKLYANFVYTGQESSQGGVMLLFGPSMTAQQINTPFRTTNETQNHRWPPILLELKYILFNGNYYIRQVYIPEVTEGTKFLTEEFSSPVPFQIPQHPVPLPSSVSYDYAKRIQFPECLHKKIKIAPDGIPSFLWQTFPATNFEDWAPYVLSDTQQYTSGIYYRKRVRVFPPIPPDKYTKIY